MRELSPHRWVVAVAASGLLVALPAAAVGTQAPVKPTARPAPAVTTGVGPAVPAGVALSIRVDDGRPDARRGDRLRYAITVKNIGSVDVRGLSVTQTLPKGVTALSAEPTAGTDHGRLEWKRDLRAGATAVLTTTATLATLPAGQQRFATVACATGPGSARPSVCAADSDLLPEASLPVAAAVAARGGGGAGGAPDWLPPAAAGLALLAGAGAAVGLRRRRRPATHAGESAAGTGR